MILTIQDTFNKELPADPIVENIRRQVKNVCYSFVLPKKTQQPELLHVSTEMLAELGISEKDSQSNEFLKIVTGNEILPNSQPYAMSYGGHQFGNWAGQLGDGRAINLAEVVHNNKRWALQLKGAGETPYSRTADGLAVVRSSIREYLCSEAMFHLGVPTTRALSLSLTGDEVLRDVLYNGNAAYEKGAIVCRVSPSFIRFGNFEILAARDYKNTLGQLVDYTIKYFYSHLGKPSKEVYVRFFEEVSQKTLDMIIHWQRVGFVHGVMNTDNMSILGLTIDYGPYGWLEGYDPNWTPNTTDRQYKRYRFGNQSEIGLWNLYKLANAICVLIEDAAPLQNVLDNYKTLYSTKYLTMMKSKLGLVEENSTDAQLVQELENVLQQSETDMTLFFRKLADFKSKEVLNINFIDDAFYSPQEIDGEIKNRWLHWFESYSNRLALEIQSDENRAIQMNKVNPKYVLRNYMAQLAIDAADVKDYTLIEELYQLLKRPYDEQPENEKWFVKRPDWAKNKVGCSMLSCSS